MNDSYPMLDERRLLPEGLHTVTLDQVEELFGGFQRTTRRMDLFKALRRYVEEVQRAGFATEIRIDGSFVMGAVDEPDDIDVVLVMRQDWDVGAADIRPAEYNLLSRKRTKKAFEIEVYSVLAGIADMPDGMTAFFTQISPRWTTHYAWPPGLKKGILRVVL